MVNIKQINAMFYIKQFKHFQKLNIFYLKNIKNILKSISTILFFNINSLSYQQLIVDHFINEVVTSTQDTHNKNIN